MQEKQVQSLRQGNPLGEEMATHSSIPSLEILWTEVVLRWQRNRIGRPLSPAQIYWKITWTLSKYHKATSDCWRRTPGTQKEIPWTEEPGGLPFMGLQRIHHDWANQHACPHYKDIQIISGLGLWIQALYKCVKLFLGVRIAVVVKCMVRAFTLPIGNIHSGLDILSYQLILSQCSPLDQLTCQKIIKLIIYVIHSCGVVYPRPSKSFKK